MEGWKGVPLVVFHCLYSAHRAPTCANWYRERVDEQRVAILHEGFRGWQGNGFPVTYPTQESEKLPPPSQCVANTAVHTDVVSSGKHVKPPPVPTAVPVASGVEELDPGTVYTHLASHDCLLVDLRDTDRESGIIEGSVHVPAIDVVSFPSKIPLLVPAWAEQSLVVFMCQYSAHRAPQCANWYREKADSKQRVAVLVDGYRGWEGSGLPAKHPSATRRDEAADDFAVQQGLRFAASQLGAPVVTAS
jgi:rhodanese-related sulfurtransferase